MTDQGISLHTLAEAEKLAGVEYTPAERELMLDQLEAQVARVAALRGTPLPNALPPAGMFDPRLPGRTYEPPTGPSDFARPDPGTLPESQDDIAYAPVTALAHWLRTGAISARDLTEIYLERLHRFGPGLECIVTVTESLAREQADRADAEIAAGRYRGPLHGIPWGAKDLLDTAGIRTTWGATPYRDRVPEGDAAVVRRLSEAGAVLVAKTTLGALAYGDVWFGGRTRNPWNTEEGSSGSSAGSAAAVAAGLVAFAIGTETLGSIVSPSMRCGATGLRPTYGRVSRVGAMALCWSLDKIGPIARNVVDTALVLSTINGYDPADAGSIDAPFHFDVSRDITGMRLGFDPSWFEQEAADPLDTRVLDAARGLGLELVEVALPDLPYEALWSLLAVEAAAAFEELTLTGRDDLLVRQDVAAWPNSFRKARLVSAVDYVQVERFRRLVAEEMDAILQRVDALVGPSFAGNVQLVTNMTGHPSLTLRTGFVSSPARAAINPIGAVPKPDAAAGPPHRVPHGITLWGRLFDEGTLCNVGLALERHFDVWQQRPPGF